jgi:DNA polymerase III alpha subunit (gram-positive type)
MDRAMARHIVLDTETTGLDPNTGHRLIEIACVEVVDYIPTGREFHQYVHPDRAIDPDAERVHGISLAMLQGKPRFHQPEVVDAFLAFIGEDVLVAHNAPFDRGFINAELARCQKALLPEARWIDTLALAKKIDTVKAFEWGTNVSPEGKDDGFTHCFFVTFKDKAGLEVYLPHPDHKAFGALLRPILDKVLVIDYTAQK